MLDVSVDFGVLCKLTCVLLSVHDSQTDRMKTIGQLWRAMTVEERDKVPRSITCRIVLMFLAHR